MANRGRRLFFSLPLVVLVVAAACGTNREFIEGEPSTPRPRASTTAVLSPAAPTPTPTAVPTPRPRVPLAVPPPLPLTPIQGIFAEPQATIVDRRLELPPRPEPTFEVGTATRPDDALLFDTLAGTVTNLGRGFRGEFSPDGTRMSWVRITPAPAGDVRVLELTTGEQRRLGTGVDSAPWIDDETVLSVNSTATARIAIDVTTGTATTAPIFVPASEPFTSEVRGALQLVLLSDGLPARYELRDRPSGSMLLRFEAEAAGLAGDGELVLATPASGAEFDTNIFLVDVESATATFVASTQLGSRPLIALSATDGFIAWSHRFCTADATVQVFDRSRSTILEVAGVGWAELTPTNDLAIGEFGARSIVDLETGEFTTVLPGPQNEVNWSPDYRYASVGAQLEHGSRCP